MRLHELHINNFKFFPKQDPNSPLLKIDGKNLLIYGENGSGKSTIYWALYTLLESSLKEKDEDILKYFDKRKSENLINIFVKGKNETFIEAVLRDGLTTKNYRVSGKNKDLSIRGSSDVTESSMASDFINYRVLFQLHNLKHSKDNDLWQWFYEEIFPYVKIKSTPCLKTYNTLKNGPDKVKDIHGNDILPTELLRSSEIEQEAKDYRKYKDYVMRLRFWNSWLHRFLKEISATANDLIEKEFKYDFKIKLELEYVPFKNKNEKKYRIVENGVEEYFSPEFELYPPKIIISLTEYQGVNNPKIKKLHTFLNEAKWSAIGLAIRFAVLDTKLYSADLKALVIDDMLISLDMSNRDVVLDLILKKYSTDYQLILMTHDRFLFELAQKKITSLRQTNWKYLEMFDDERTGQSKPLIIEKSNQINKAWALFHAKEFDLSANTLRKATEKLCKSYLTAQERLNTDYSMKQLHDMIIAFQTKGTANGLDAAKLARLIDYKDRVLNPSSHYDIETPLFKTELEMAIKTVEELANDTGLNI